MSSSMTPPSPTFLELKARKTSRDLIFFSSFIIIGWWLNINLADILSKQFDTNIPGWKLNVVYLFILFYLNLYFVMIYQDCLKRRAMYYLTIITTIFAYAVIICELITS